jgi:hypothetical protein
VTRVAFEKADKDFLRRRLACAARSEEAEDFATLNREVESAYGGNFGSRVSRA